MKVSKIIQLLYTKSKKSRGLSQVYKQLCSLDDNILVDFLGGKPFPDFNSFRNSMKSEKRHFNLSEGLRILESYSKGEVVDIDLLSINESESSEDREENIDLIFYKREYGLSQLHKHMKTLDKGVLKKILKDKPFPDFNTFRKSFEGEDRKFCLSDGLLILKYYSNGEVYDMELPKLYKKAFNRSITQSRNFEKRDSQGLLGIQVPRPKKKKKHKKVVRSVWTVKKK